MEIATHEVTSYITDLFESACIKQIESLDCEIEKAEHLGKAADTSTSTINAESNDLKITLVLTIPKTLLEQILPDIGEILSVDISILEDWSKELANRFLGRLKNKLVPHDCILKMGFPILCQADDVATLFEDDGEKITLYFRVNNEIIECCLLLNIINKSMTLGIYEDEDEDWFDESELMHL